MISHTNRAGLEMISHTNQVDIDALHIQISRCRCTSHTNRQMLTFVRIESDGSDTDICRLDVGK
jgi:hypothetical protein